MLGEDELVKRYNINDINMERGDKKKNKVLIMKDNTLRSLKEVEFFLGSWKRAAKGIKLFKILR